MKRFPLLWLALLPLAACAGSTPAQDASVVPATCGTIPNLHAFGDVWLAGQPAATDFAAVKEAGVRTVIDLRHEAEHPGFDERAAVLAAGLTYVALPWNGPDELTDAVFERSRELLDGAQRPLLLHCGSANRVGAVWIPWRVLDGGVPLETAVAEAREIGLKTPAYETKARDYVARQGGS